jgi:hypothetical protein
MAIGCGLPKKRSDADHLNRERTRSPKHEAVKIILPSEVVNISPFVQGFTQSRLILCTRYEEKWHKITVGFMNRLLLCDIKRSSGLWNGPKVAM